MTPTPPQAGERAEALDAARYRFLRVATLRDWVVCRDKKGGGVLQFIDRDLDTAIDAAIAAIDSEESK